MKINSNNPTLKNYSSVANAPKRIFKQG